MKNISATIKAIRYLTKFHPLTSLEVKSWSNRIHQQYPSLKKEQIEEILTSYFNVFRNKLVRGVHFKLEDHFHQLYLTKVPGKNNRLRVVIATSKKLIKKLNSND